MSGPDSGYASPKDAGAGYDGGTDAGGGYTTNKDSGTGYAPSVDAGADQASPIFGNGVNLQPSYSNSGKADLGWTLMKSIPAVKTLRIMIEPGMNQEAMRWINEAQDNGYEVIGCYNKAGELASDNPDLLIDAAKWWAANYATLKGKKGITINIRNEWGSHGLDPQAYADAYNQAIALIRPVYKGRLIIDGPGYAQGATKLLQSLKTVSRPIIDRNIILSIHVYPSSYDAATNKGLEKTALKNLNDTGIPCMLGEFGSRTDSNVITSWMDLVDYAKSLKWPVLAWSWAADSTGGPADPRNMNMIDSAQMTQLRNAKKDAAFDPFVQGKPAAYTKSAYFSEVAPKL